MAGEVWAGILGMGEEDLRRLASILGTAVAVATLAGLEAMRRIRAARGPAAPVAPVGTTTVSGAIVSVTQHAESLDTNTAALARLNATASRLADNIGHLTDAIGGLLERSQSHSRAAAEAVRSLDDATEEIRVMTRELIRNHDR